MTIRIGAGPFGFDATPLVNLSRHETSAFEASDSVFHSVYLAVKVTRHSNLSCTFGIKRFCKDLIVDDLIIFGITAVTLVFKNSANPALEPFRLFFGVRYLLGSERVCNLFE